MEGKITTLKAENFTLRDKSYTGEKLEDAMRREAQYEQAQKDLNTLQANFATAAGLWNEQLGRIARKYPNDRFDLDGQITSLLQRSNVKSSTVNGISTVEVFSERTVEVPVQDSRTKHLIHLLATNMKRLAGKYPKLL